MTTNVPGTADIYPKGRGCPACDGTGFVSDEDVERVEAFHAGLTAELTAAHETHEHYTKGCPMCEDMLSEYPDSVR